MRTNIRILLYSILGLCAQAGLSFADSVKVTETHNYSSKTTTYTILGMDQTLGIVVIAGAVIVLFLIIAMISRSSSKSTTTVIK